MTKPVNLLSFLPIKHLRYKLNEAFKSASGGCDRPVIFSIEETCPELLVLENNYHVILDELMVALDWNREIPKYHEIDSWQNEISKNGHGNWQVDLIESYGHEPFSSRTFSETKGLLKKVPNVLQAFFSILSGGKCIPPHSGPYAGYLRYHLPLVLPKTDPPLFVIAGEETDWEIGKGLLFDDTWEHQVKNDSQHIRALLIVDIQRPMKFPYSTFNHYFIRVFGQHYGKRICRNTNSQLRGSHE